VSPDKSDKSGTFTMTVSANASTESRTGTLTFVMEGKTVATLTVVQTGFGTELEVTPATPAQVVAAGGSLEFAVAANADWTYSLSAGADTWLTSPVKTDGALTLTVAANAATEAKTATVTFSLTGYPAVTQVVNVAQAAFAPELAVTPTAPEQLSSASGSLEFAVGANTEWTYSLSAGADAWLTATKTDGALTLTVAVNPSITEDRNATVTFSLTGYPEITQAVNVSQSAIEFAEEDFGAGVTPTVLTATASNLKSALEGITTAGNYVVNISENATLSDAADNGTNITLGTAGVTISLRGAGSNTISPANDANIVKVNEGKLILRSITLSKTGGNMPTVNVGANGTLEINEGVSITNSSPGNPTNAGVDVTGLFLMKGGEIHGHRRAGGGAGVNLRAGSTFQMDGGKIYDNSANYAGGVLIIGAGARFIMNGGEMYDNHSTAADEGGGAVYIWQNGGVEIHPGAVIYGENGDGSSKAGNTATNATYGHAVTAFFTGSSGRKRSTTIQNETLSITLSGGSATEESGAWDNF
jgi:hypothetical protein